MASSAPPSTLPLAPFKALALTTTLLLTGSALHSTLSTLPALLFATAQPPSRPLPSRRNSGRLTPQPGPARDKQSSYLFPAFTPATPDAAGGYKLAAQQFILVSHRAALTQTPAKLLAMLSSAYLAYALQRAGSATLWRPWALVAALIAVLPPFEALMVAPLARKMGRLAGAEDAVESYEDAPFDGRAEAGNAEAFLTRLGVLGGWRCGVLGLAGGVAVWAALA